MKKIYLLTISLLVTLSVCAQDPNNINVTAVRFNYKYRVMPSKPKEPLFFDYGVKVEATPAVYAIYDRENLERRLEIYGQNKVAEFTEDDYVLSAKFKEMVISSSSVQQDSGSYYMVIKYQFNPEIELIKGNEDTEVPEEKPKGFITFSGGSASSEKTHTSEAFKTAKEAGDFWKNNMELIKADILRKDIDATIAWARSSISSKYGFNIEGNTWPEKVFSMKTEKHSENTAMNEMARSLAEKLKSLDGSTPLTEEAVAEEFAYFKAIPERFADTNPKNKADAKLRYIAYFNIGNAYLLMDKPEEAIVWADKIIANDCEPKEGEKMKERAAKLTKTLSGYISKTRQFDPQQFNPQAMAR